MKVNAEKLDYIIHHLLSIVNMLKVVESDLMSQGQQEMIHACETRLLELRQELVTSIEEDKED